MGQRSWVFLVGLFVLPLATWAAEEPSRNIWKVTLLTGDKQGLWLLKLEPKDGKWTGEVVAASENMGKTTLEDLGVKDDVLRFKLKVAKQNFTFEGKVPTNTSQHVFGSLILGGGRLYPAQLERTTLKSLDDFELNKEVLAGQGSGPEIISAATVLLRQAATRKAKPEEVRGWAEKGLKAAEPFGKRMQREMALRAAEGAAGPVELAPVAVEYARRAESLLNPDDGPAVRKPILEALAAALKANQAAEAAELEARAKKIELVKLEPFTSRISNSGRVVVVELFTGAQCPPCIAADLAFDALTKTYKPTEVVLLQYHVHIPGPDPLTTPDNEARQAYYSRVARGTPTILVNGQPGAEGGGSRFEAQDKYHEYLNLIKPLLEAPARAKIKAAAVQKGDKIEITAEVADLETPGEKVRLRLALIEEEVQYKGGNRLPLHHHVVRAMPGGVHGLALTGPTGKQAVTVDLEKLRQELTAYLDTFAKKNPFPNPNRPLAFKNLRVVAFVQNDETKEILQGTQVEVQAESAGTEK